MEEGSLQQLVRDAIVSTAQPQAAASSAAREELYELVEYDLDTVWDRWSGKGLSMTDSQPATKHCGDDE